MVIHSSTAPINVDFVEVAVKTVTVSIPVWLIR